jgi:molecular chaperone DnaK
VTASDKATGRSQKITITASSGLSKEEIERMKVEAEQHSEEDEKRKDLIEAKNYADNAAYTAEKTLRENGEKIADDQKKKAEELVAKLRETAAGEDTDAIRKQTEELGQLIQQIGASLYQQEDAGQATDSTDEKAPGEDPTGGPDGEDVVDGEFKNV